jgi:putative membrane protein
MKRKEVVIMKSLFFIAALTVSSLAASTALPQGKADGTQQPPAQGQTLDSADRKFLSEASSSGLAEVKLGQMATKQAASEDVKKFGQRMVDDHTRINSDLTKLAQQKSVTLPQTLDKKHQDQVDRLAKLGGVDFDKSYMSEMVDEHQHDVDTFEKAAKDAKDSAVKNLASSTLPTLREHLASAKEIHARVKEQKKP